MALQIDNTESLIKDSSFSPKGLVLPIALLFLWIVGTWNTKSLLFPSPEASFNFTVSLWESGKLTSYFSKSLYRFFIGFVTGTTLGFIAGILLSSSRWIERFFLPNLNAFRMIPLVGWIPLLVIWFGLNDTARIVLIAMGTFFPMTISTYAGFRNVSKKFIEVGSVLGFGKFKRIWKIILPAALPSIRSGTLMSLNFGWTILVASELLTETNGGLSDIIDFGRERFHLEQVNAGIIILGVTGFLLNFILNRFWSIGKLKTLSAGNK